MWSIIRQRRQSGAIQVYLAQWKGTQKQSAITIGQIQDDPPTMDLTTRVRQADPEGQWTDDEIRAVCLERDVTKRGYLTLAANHRVKTASAQPPVVEATEAAPLPSYTAIRITAATKADPLHPKGGTTLRFFVDHVWERVRARQGETWKRESWWWQKRILPCLGSVRLCDLDTDQWTEFLDSLTGTCGGRSKAIAQTAYRTALTHAAEILKWIPAVHPFRDIKGSTVRTLAEPEPLTADEVSRFLAATPTRMHRALFAFAIGQGLRPSEVIRLRWEDVDWSKCGRSPGSTQGCSSEPVHLRG